MSTSQLTTTTRLSRITLGLLSLCCSLYFRFWKAIEQETSSYVEETEQHNCNWYAPGYMLFYAIQSTINSYCRALWSVWQTVLSTILEKQAPLRTRIVTLRPHALSALSIREQKSICCRLKRHWRHSSLASDYQFYVGQHLIVMKEISFKLKMEFSNVISDPGSDNKTLFRSILFLSWSTATQFVTFFENKIDKIRSRLKVLETPEPFHGLDKSSLNCKMDTFSATSTTELSKVHTIISKSCSLDPFPSALMKEHLDLHLSTLCRIVNVSLESGHLPSSLKTAVLLSVTKNTFFGSWSPW